MKKSATILFGLFFAVFAAMTTACGKTAGPSETLRVEMGRGQIKEIYFNDTPIFRGTGGYYIIGNCPGNSGDGPDNIVSYLDKGDGKMSSRTGHCRDIPYTLEARREENTLVIDVTIGPAPTDYVFSLPLDAFKSPLDRFQFGGVSDYLVGCAGGWSRQDGSGGYFKDIPARCAIDGVGNVGVAKSFSAAYLEMVASGMKIRRTIVSGGAREFLFYNHPGTNNMEVGLCCSSYYRLREEISFSGR